MFVHQVVKYSVDSEWKNSDYTSCTLFPIEKNEFFLVIQRINFYLVVLGDYIDIFEMHAVGFKALIIFMKTSHLIM